MQSFLLFLELLSKLLSNILIWFNMKRGSFLWLDDALIYTATKVPVFSKLL